MEESEYRAVEMPFCGSVVDYPACVPEQKPIPPDRKFHRDGRWVNHTTPTKDEVYALFGLELHLITFLCVSTVGSNDSERDDQISPRT
jgi:hypothetical protein